MELISIPEAARRLGVSETAVHKAIAEQRISVAERTPKGYARLEWPAVRDEWLANSDTMKRSHVGSRGSPKRADDEGDFLPRSDSPDEGPQPTTGAAKSVPPIGQSRAIKEAYAAKIARLEFEERSKKVISAEEVEKSGRRLAAAIISGLYLIPDRISDELAGMNDAHEIAAFLTKEFDQVVQELRALYGQ